MTGYTARLFRRGIYIGICAGLFILAASVQQIYAQSENKDNIKGPPDAEIKKASMAFSDAFVSGDTDAIRNLYTEDAAILPPGQTIRGNSKIADYFAPRPNRVIISHSMESSELKVDFDLAVDIGIWKNTWKIGEAEAQSASGQYLVVWRRGPDGRWRIQYDMWHRPNE